MTVVLEGLLAVIHPDIIPIGERHQFILELYQKWIQVQNLVDPTQFVDFSSTYFEPEQRSLGTLQEFLLRAI